MVHGLNEANLKNNPKYNRWTHKYDSWHIYLRTNPYTLVQTLALKEYSSRSTRWVKMNLGNGISVVFDHSYCNLKPVKCLCFSTTAWYYVWSVWCLADGQIPCFLVNVSHGLLVFRSLFMYHWRELYIPIFSEAWLFEFFDYVCGKISLNIGRCFTEWITKNIMIIKYIC